MDSNDLISSQAHGEGVFTLSLLNVPGSELKEWLDQRYSNLTVEKYLEMISRIYQTIVRFFGVSASSPAQYSMRNLLTMEKTEEVHEKLIGENKQYRRAMDMLLAFSAAYSLEKGDMQDALWDEVVTPTQQGFLVWLLERFTKSTAERYVRVLSKVDAVLNAEKSLFSQQPLRDVVSSVCRMDMRDVAKHDPLYKKRVVRDMLDAFTSYAVMLVGGTMEPVVLPDPAEIEGDLPMEAELNGPRQHETRFGVWLADVVATPRVIRNYVSLVNEAGNFAVQRFMCRHLFNVESVREGRRIIAMIRQDPDGYERFFRRKVDSRVFLRYESYLSYSRRSKAHEAKPQPPILALEAIGQHGDVPIEFSLAAFRSWAGSEVTGRVLQSYVDILNAGAAHALGRYGDLMHVRTVSEAHAIIASLRRDEAFASVHMSRAPQRRAYRLLMQYLTILAGKQDTRREENIARLSPEWRPYAQWMAKRRYSSSHIKRRITALRKMELLLQSVNAGIESMAACRDSSVLRKVHELEQAGTLKIKKKNWRFALEKFFQYVQDEFGGDFEQRPTLMLGDYSNTARSFRDWLISVGIKEGSERNYITGLRDLGACLGDEKVFFMAQTVEDVVQLKERCESTELYAQWNSGVKDFPKQVYNWFMDFLTSHTIVSMVDVSVQLRTRETQLRDILMKEYEGVLSELNAEVCNEVRQYWESLFKERCPLSHADVRRYLLGITVHDDVSGRYFLPEVVIPEAALGYITAFVEDAFASGLRYVHYESLMSKTAAAFPEVALHWHGNRMALFRDSLRHRLPLRFSFGSKAIKRPTLEKTSPARALSDMICQFMREQRRPVTLDEIQARFPQISPKIISRICSNREGAAADFVLCLNKGRFCHVDVVKVPDSEWQRFTRELALMVRRKEVSQGELFAMGKSMFPGWFVQNELISTPIMFFKYVRRRTHGKYTFTRSFIFPLGAEKQTIVQNFADVCSELGNAFTTAQLREILDQYHIGMNPPWEIIFNSSVRVSSEHFVSKNDVSFDVARTDEALAQLCPKAVTPIVLAKSFASFPPGSHPWNIYLLEQFVYQYSERYMLLHTRFGTEVKGFIVRKDAGIDTFEEAFARHIAEMDVRLDSASVMVYASLRGIVASKRYGKLPMVLKRALELRSSAPEA